MTLTFPKWIIQLSDWVDNKFFPATTDEQALAMIHERSRKVEAAAKWIGKEILACRTLEQSYGIMTMIVNMKRLYGPSTQVSGWAHSLHLAVYKKQQQIIENL